ncbi:uncharacterized protein LOC143224856 isoform X2 [Tachypleus tridentatus]|uniref:uncharacterized protein LOC143224856 isoform X2 n=1 Tax=Tachypleus tridentatus TaxID=6853 RepID=UPI003FD488F4
MTSASRVNDGMVVRVEGLDEREDYPHSSSFSNLSLVSLPCSPGGKKTRNNRAERCKTPNSEVGERKDDKRECHGSSGHKSRSKSSHLLPLSSDGDDHGRRDSIQVPSRQIPPKKDKRKNSYPEVLRADRKAYSSSRRSSRVEDLSRRSSRVPSKTTNTLEHEHDEENVQLWEGRRRRKVVIIVICSVSLFILITSVVLVTATLSLSSTIDQLVRKENEEILKDVLSTLSTSIDGAIVNDTINMTGQPG